MIITIIAALAIFAAGWYAHQRLNTVYKRRWLGAVKSLEDKELESSDTDLSPSVPRISSRVDVAGAYVPGQWALDELVDGSTVTFMAIRRGFDPVRLGHTANFKRFSALYRRDYENALEAVKDMNARP